MGKSTKVILRQNEGLCKGAHPSISDKAPIMLSWSGAEDGNVSRETMQRMFDIQYSGANQVKRVDDWNAPHNNRTVPIYLYKSGKIFLPASHRH